jgi:hypothetical protein
LLFALWCVTLRDRTKRAGDSLKEIGIDIDQFEKDPNSLMQIRARLTQVGNEVVLLEEILNYIQETCDATGLPAGPESETDHIGVQLFEILDLENTANTLRLRTADMRKNITGCRHKIETLREQCQVISERQMMNFQEAMNNNSKNLEDMFKAAERSGQSLEMMQVLLSGTLAFEILDRLTVSEKRPLLSHLYVPPPPIIVPRQARDKAHSKR